MTGHPKIPELADAIRDMLAFGLPSTGGDYDGKYVVISDPVTEQFVQFKCQAWYADAEPDVRHISIIMDLPLGGLDEGQAERAAAFFRERGVECPSEQQVLLVGWSDASDEMRPGFSVSYELDCKRDADYAADAALRLLNEVFWIGWDAFLEIEIFEA